MNSTRQQEIEDWILYSTCDEDAESELSALAVNAEDDVLCVTGSACRTLSLISRNPRSITSIDYAAGQNYLLELKLAAIRHLDYDHLLGFLGVEAALNPREADYQNLKQHLSPAAQRYFSHYMRDVKAGILFRGRHEKFYIRVMAPFLQLFYGRALKEIFSTDSLEQQKRLYFEKVRSPFFAFLIRKGFNKSLLTAVLNNPDYEVEVEVGNLGNYMLETLDHTFSTHLAKESDWLSLMFNGQYLSRHALPHFLQEEVVRKIKAARTEIHIIRQDIVQFSIQAPEAAFSKFSLSDISSCIAKPRFMELLTHIPRIGRDNGRLCYRNFIARHKIPQSLNGLLTRDNELCNRLNRDDRAFSYQFEIATVSGSH